MKHLVLNFILFTQICGSSFSNKNSLNCLYKLLFSAKQQLYLLSIHVYTCTCMKRIASIGTPEMKLMSDWNVPRQFCVKLHENHGIFINVTKKQTVDTTTCNPHLASDIDPSCHCSSGQQATLSLNCLVFCPGLGIKKAYDITTPKAESFT